MACIYLPTLVLIAQAVFLLEHGQTDRQTVTDATESHGVVTAAHLPANEDLTGREWTGLDYDWSRHEHFGPMIGR